MSLLTIPFGSAGASWFWHQRTTKAGKLVGLRWIPSYYRNGEGYWRGPTTVPAVPADFTRQPVCPKPSPPQAVTLAARETAAKRRAEQAAAARQLAASFQPGDRVTFVWDGRVWPGKVANVRGRDVWVDYQHERWGETTMHLRPGIDAACKLQHATD